jgi:hypothetical protein
MAKKLKPLVIPREVTIKVTRKNIDTGVFNDTEKCAIALAIKAKLGDSPQVDSGVVEIDLKCGIHASYRLPKIANKFIKDFDACDELGSSYQKEARAKLKPFTFKALLRYANFEL